MTDQQNRRTYISQALTLLATAIIVSGFFVNQGLQSFGKANRIITVKGLAEREVQADLAVWTLSHTATGNDLATVQTQIETNQAKIMTFLKSKGITDAEIEQKPLQSQDLLAQSYRPDGVDKGRYIITQNINVRTNDIGKLDTALAGIGDLLRGGVSLSSTNPPVYFFTKLNDIKPAMLADATKNGLQAATELAAEAGAKVGAIKQASQGQFQILPRDPVQYENEQNQKNKIIRVVTTVDFFLR